MKTAFGITILIVLLFACKKADIVADTDKTPVIEGTYMGTFQRQSVVSGSTIDVTIFFGNKNWIGQTAVGSYPFLCAGTFTNNTNEIFFKNDCITPLGFDESYVLSDTFKIKLTKDSLEMSRAKPNYIDIYKLRKKN